MELTPQRLTTAKPFETRWLWGVRVAAVTSILLLCMGLLWPPRSASLQDFVFLLLPMLLPYGHILWRLLTKAQKSGLALAVATGVGSVGVLVLVLQLGFVEGATGKVIASLFALTQVGLALTAVTTYRTMAKEPTDKRTLERGFAGFALYFVLFFLSISAQSLIAHSRKASPEASAIASLRTINTAEAAYAGIYGTGYSPSLSTLGPPPEGREPTALDAGLVDPLLAIGQKSGYTFTYAPGAVDSRGRVMKYTVFARPVKFGETGKRSFYTDETGLMRATGEDRPATVQDPAIGQ